MYLSRIKQSSSVLLIAGMFAAASAAALSNHIPIQNIMENYSFNVLIILISMELFTNLITETGIMQVLSVRLAALSKGRKRLSLVFFGILMFLISSFLNNITAVMMVLPVMFVLLKTIDVDERYVSTFFAVILALSNTGGAASPVGDFPAIVIMTSGITSFLGYLTHAFPLFAVMSCVLIAYWGMRIQKERDDGNMRMLAIRCLRSQYKNIRVRSDVLRPLTVILVCMFLAWSFVPQETIPPEVIAVLGYVLSAAVCSLKGIKVRQSIDFKSVLTIAAFLFFAEVVSQTGILTLMAEYLQGNIADTKILILVIMVITSLIAGVFSAGPAAAAMMPVITEICSGLPASQCDWIAVAYAAAICSGSSLFMWSATAGFILSDKVNHAKIKNERGENARWGISQYLKYGLQNYAIQLGIAVICIWLIL
ncbi:MAG: SLC13 family permease [Anaerovoracaceae bacterium]